MVGRKPNEFWVTAALQPDGEHSIVVNGTVDYLFHQNEDGIVSRDRGVITIGERDICLAVRLGSDMELYVAP
jgi:hypothetical protein